MSEARRPYSQLAMEKSSSTEEWFWGLSLIHSITTTTPITARASSLLLSSSYSSFSSSTSTLVSEDISFYKELAALEPFRDSITFNELSKEIHLLILSHLSPTELLKISQVSRYWQSLAYDGSLWAFADMSPYHRHISPRQLTMIFKTSGGFIRNLNLRGCNSVTGCVIKTLSLHCPNLENINLSGCRRISSLQLEQLLDNAPYLTHINLSGLFSVTAAVIEALVRNCPRLEKVNLAWCKHLTTDSIYNLVASCQHIYSLNLNGCQALDTRTIRKVGLLGNLSDLSLSKCEIGDNELLSFIEGGVKNLVRLNLSNVAQLTELSLGALARRRPPLTWLDISGCAMVSENGFQLITEHLRSLTYLGAESCPHITDRTLRRLGAQLPELCRLALGGCEGVTDPGIYALLRGCKKLTSLELDNCPNLSDGVLRCLTTWIPNRLDKLDVFDCRNLSHAALEEVSRERPNLNIRSFYSGFQMNHSHHRHLFEGFESDSSSTCQIL